MIVSTFPLTTPRTSRRSSSTAMTLYFSSKIDFSVSFIQLLDAELHTYDSHYRLRILAREGFHKTQQCRVRCAPHWSLLTILLLSNGALCSHESQTETSLGGSLSHLWRKTGGKMRAQHWPAPHRPASGSALGGLGKVKVTRGSGERWLCER